MIEQNSIYLLLGPENGEKKQYIKKIISNIQTKINSNPEIFRFYPFEKQMVDIIALLQSRLLFSVYKVVIVNNIENIKNKHDLNLLCSYCKNPAQDTCLILVSDTVSMIDKSIEKVIDKKKRFIFWELLEDRKQGWIINFFKRRGISIQIEALDFIMEMVGNSTNELEEICGKIALYLGKGANIKYVDIEQYIYHSKEENVFTLFERIITRNLPGSLEVLHKMYLSRNTEPIGILAGILWQIKKVLSLKRLALKGYPLHEIFAKLNIKSKKTQKLYNIGKEKFTINELELIITRIAECDTMLRIYNSDWHEFLINLLLYYIIIRGGNRCYNMSADA